MKNIYQTIGDITIINLNKRDGSVLQTKVSTLDLSHIRSFSGAWVSTFKAHLDRYYVVGNLVKENGTKTTIQLHRFIMNCPKGMYVDHIDGDSLNNTRENLRIVTNSENLQNRIGLNSNNTSNVRGVSYDRYRNKWEVKFRKNYKTLHFGRYDTFEEARVVAERVVKEIFEVVG